jgi:hypothetical protein
MGNRLNPRIKLTIRFACLRFNVPASQFDEEKDPVNIPLSLRRENQKHVCRARHEHVSFSFSLSLSRRAKSCYEPLVARIRLAHS